MTAALAAVATALNVACRVTMTRLALYNALRAVSLSMSTDETRFHLHGVAALWDGDKFQLCSTDGHTLALLTPVLPIGGQCATYGDAKQETIIPAATVKTWIKALRPNKSQRDQTVELLSYGKERIELHTDDGVLGSKPIDAQFPPFEQVVPEPREATIKRERKLSHYSGATTDDCYETQTFGVNAGYLVRAGEVARAFIGRSDFHGVRVFPPPRALDPIRFDFDHPDAGSGLIVVMPMRI